MNRKKELKAQYKQMKPEMGVFVIKSKVNGKCLLNDACDLKSAINSSVFKLKAGLHPVHELQRDWNQYGEDSFAMEVVDKLDYKKDGSKTDYTDDLAELCGIWREKLLKEGITFY